MDQAKKKISGGKERMDLIDEVLPHFESFIESREKYIKALEMTIDVLKHENENRGRNNLDIRSSIDELVAMHRLANTISTAMTPEAILSALIDLTRQVIPVIDSNIYLLDSAANRLTPLSALAQARLQEEAQEQLESGIVDWVFSEKKTVIIPDLKSLVVDTPARNFVIVPLFVRNAGIGIYLIHTEKAQQEFSNQDIQLLSILANQAAAGVENWRTYDQLMQLNKELKASEAQMISAARLAAIGELAASIVHEIKNPVQVLMLQLDVMKRGTVIPNADELFRQQVTRLHEITKRLMNFARNVTEEFTITPTDVNKAIIDAVAMVEHEYKLDKIVFQLNLEGQLPLIPGNVSYLQQVFLNLAINARDAMPKGGKLTIETANVELDASFAHDRLSLDPGPYIVLAVSDTGTGMDSKTQERIFEPFFTTKERGKGTGLGLSTAYGVIKQSGGSIWVYSELGRGTTFKVYLPRVDEQSSPEPAAQESEKPLEGTETILVVEDAPAVRALIRATLGAHGYNVLEACSSEEALVVLEKTAESISLVLTDVVMPGMSGRELAKAVKTTHPATKVLYMSGYTDDAVLRHGVLEPGSYFIQKPFRPIDLLRKVRHVADLPALA